MSLPSEGVDAPRFCLPSTDGTEFNLQSERGTPTVLYFYPKDETPGCTWEARSFRAQFEMLSRRQTTIVGISRDNIANHCSFQGKEGLPFQLLSDEDGSVHDAYGAWRRTMGIRSMRRCTFILAPDLTVAKVYPYVLPIGHAKTVAQDVEALGRARGWFD